MNGNLIALPLQGQALKNGNSAFVDGNWNAYPDQWDILFNRTEKLSIEDIEKYMAKWQAELAESKGKLALIRSNRTEAGSSSGFCGTSCLRMARSRILDFAFEASSLIATFPISILSTVYITSLRR